MSEDKFDVIIVGAGIAGCTSAYLLAKAGLETLLIERGNFPGAKNVTGGRLYAHSIEKIFPNFAEEAPIERSIVHEKLSFMDDSSSVTLDYTSPEADDPACRSYTVLRSNFDAWLAEKAQSEGANIVSGILVEDLTIHDNKVCGVIAGDEEVAADVVILADGVNSMLGQKLGMVSGINIHNTGVGVKEVIKLNHQLINDRFGCLDNEGVAWLFAGSPSDGQKGGGFLYTNKDSISLGLVFSLHNIKKFNKSIPQMLEDFKNHPTIMPLIAGGKTVEYSAHAVPEGGYGMVPEMVNDGVLIAGDAAGLCLNMGYTIRGMDLALASGEAAANAIIKAKKAGNFNKADLASYTTALDNSFVMKDLLLYRKIPDFLGNPRILNQYPAMLTNIMSDLYTMNGTSAPFRQIVMPHLKKVGTMNLIKDGLKGAMVL